MISVSRSELRSKSSSPNLSSSGEEARTQWQVQLDLVYEDDPPGLDNGKPEKDSTAATGAIEEPDEEAYHFRLFSARPGRRQGSGDEPPKVCIRSPEPVTRDPGFVQPRRPDGYYFSRHGEAGREQYKAVAIEGERVLEEARVKWPGFELPWRVTTVTTKLSKRPKGATVIAQAEATGNRKRSGKKRRIAMRIRTQAQRGKEEKLRQAEACKEELEKEKRNRRNREKKVKRREKARAIKKGGALGMVAAFR
ncbi:MAG: hypothetical protein Q9196_002326 [Gyalolechia fulgens]